MGLIAIDGVYKFYDVNDQNIIEKALNEWIRLYERKGMLGNQVLAFRLSFEEDRLRGHLMFPDEPEAREALNLVSSRNLNAKAGEFLDFYKLDVYTSDD